MIPKFRIWDKIDREIIHVDGIDFERKTVRTADVVVPFAECVLMQSTGLFDKNGVEIFEGDVVKYTEDEMTAIIRMHPILGMGIEAEGEVAWADIDLEELTELKEECEKYYEVIGNVWEDGDLFDSKN